MERYELSAQSMYVRGRDFSSECEFEGYRSKRGEREEGDLTLEQRSPCFSIRQATSLPSRPTRASRDSSSAV
jgi:hypothetical protein